VTLIPPALREAVERRARGRCEYCHLSQESQVATFPVDHIIPTVLSGPTELENLALACPRCNAKKWIHIEATDPLAGLHVALFHPRTQDWKDHFAWSISDPAVLEARTSCGRATLSFLDLNASSCVQIRRWLALAGKHPEEEA
jgi:hypothetical protein